MAQDAVPWLRRPVSRARADELAAAQAQHRPLDGALGEAGRFRDVAQAGLDRPPAAAGGGAIKVKVDEKGGRVLVVADQVAQEDIKHVVVDGNGLEEAGRGRTEALYR